MGEGEGRRALWNKHLETCPVVLVETNVILSVGGLSLSRNYGR